MSIAFLSFIKYFVLFFVIEAGFVFVYYFYKLYSEVGEMGFLTKALKWLFFSLSWLLGNIIWVSITKLLLIYNEFSDFVWALTLFAAFVCLGKAGIILRDSVNLVKTE